MIPGDFEFRIRQPDDPLGRFVSGVWYARGTTPHPRERILPSAGAVLLVVLGPPLRMTEPRSNEVRDMAGVWISGPHERPILNEPTGETHALGAVFEPGGIAAFRPGPVADLVDRILPAAETLTAAVNEALPPQREAEKTIDALVGVLAERMKPPVDHERWSGAIDALVSPEGGSVAELQRALGVSRRHFTAEIRRRVGLTPKSLQRIARLRRLIEELDARKPIRWSEEAVGAGYFDQPHAIREFKTFTGMTPTEYVRRRRETWGHDVEPGEAVNFVPETIR